MLNVGLEGMRFVEINFAEELLSRLEVQCTAPHD